MGKIANRIVQAAQHVLVPFILAGCVSAPTLSHAHQWTFEKVNQVAEVRGVELRRECDAKLCLLIHETKYGIYPITLDISCELEAELCIWSSGLVELYVPSQNTAEWSFRGADYKLTDQSSGAYFVEQYKDGKLFAVYSVDLNQGLLSYVIAQEEVCIDKPDGNLLCFNEHPGKSVAFSVRL